MSATVITNLKNHVLLATSKLNDTFFEGAVIYLFKHNNEGAMGITVNTPCNTLNFHSITEEFGMEDLTNEAEPPILTGGPVDPHRGFVLHTGDYTTNLTMSFKGGVNLSATKEIVADIARGAGPEHFNFCMGYAGWAPGQLEKEIILNNWLVVPVDDDILFHTPIEERYTAFAHKLGIHTPCASTYYGPTVGMA